MTGQDRAGQGRTWAVGLEKGGWAEELWRLHNNIPPECWQMQTELEARAVPVRSQDRDKGLCSPALPSPAQPSPAQGLRSGWV